MIDVVIPTCPAFGGELLERCMAECERLTDEKLNFIVVEDAPNCGAGWIEGIERSKASYIWLSADDIEICNPKWAEVCIESVDRNQLPCPVVWTPAMELESCGGNMTAPGNLNRKLVPDRTPADFGGAPFVSREQIEKIGMLAIQVCSDVWVHYRGRQLGYESVVRRDFELIHHRPSNASNVNDLQIMNKALAEVS